jgi:hypothetical protein
MVVRDRESTFEALADLAKQDLDARLNRIADDIDFWSGLWFELDQSDRNSLSELLKWGISFRRDQHDVYEMLLLVNQDGKTIFATSPQANDLDEFTKVPPNKLLGLSDDWLEPVLKHGQALIESPRQIEPINSFQKRTGLPRSREEVPSYYQLVVAVPARRSRAASAGSDGAVVAIVSWRVFQNELDRFKTYASNLGLQTGYAFLVNSKTDRVIGHELRDPARDNLYGTHLVEDHHLRGLADRLRQPSKGTFRYEFRNTSKFAAVRQIAPPDEFKDLISWGLGIGVNEPEVQQAANRMSSIYLLVAIAGTLTVAVATVLVGKKLSVSVQELIRVVREASGGAGRTSSTDDEILGLQDAVNDLVLKHRQSNVFAPLVNPYVVGNPIHHAEMFFGRTDDVNWIQEHLAQAGNEMILLTGQRRIGKTSLLRHVERLKTELRLIPFFVDTQSLIPSVSDDASFYQALLDEMLAQFPDVTDGLALPQLSRGRPRESIEKMLKYLNNERQGFVPVLLIDELENFEHKFRTGNLTPDVLSFFAAILDSTRTVSFIATGSDRLERRRAKYWNSLLIKSVRRHLGVLSQRDGLRMITEPLAGRVNYSPGIPSDILRLSGGHPYYTQDICQRLVNELNSRRSYTADRNVLDEVLTYTLQNPPPTFDYFWNKGVRPQGRVFLSILASLLTAPDERRTAQAVVDAATQALRAQLTASKSRLADTLQELSRGDWLEDSDGQIRFKVDLLRLWVQREHPPSNVEVAIRYPAVAEAQYDA